MAARHFRAHQRFIVKLPVTVTSLYRSVVSKGTTVDLGIGGGACELDTPLRLGENVSFVLDRDPRVRVVAEVVWVGWAESSAVRLGLRFQDQSAEVLPLLLSKLGVSAETGT